MWKADTWSEDHTSSIPTCNSCVGVILIGGKRFQHGSATISAWSEITSRGVSPAKTFPRAVVELFLNLPDLFIGDFSEVGLLWEILPDQAVGVFVQASFPRVVALCEVSPRSQCLIDQRMFCKLLAVVVCKRVDAPRCGWRAVMTAVLTFRALLPDARRVILGRSPTQPPRSLKRRVSPQIPS